MPLAVNDSGQVVGFSSTDITGGEHAFSWTPTGGMVDLGTLGGFASQALTVNNAGQVLGMYYTACASCANGSGQEHGFVWTSSGGMVDLGSLGGGFTEPDAESANGEVVGESKTAKGAYHAFAWTRTGGMVDLGSLGGLSVGLGVNDRGDVVGEAFTRTSSGGHALLWSCARSPCTSPTKPAKPVLPKPKPKGKPQPFAGLLPIISCGGNRISYICLGVRAHSDGRRVRAVSEAPICHIGSPADQDLVCAHNYVDSYWQPSRADGGHLVARMYQEVDRLSTVTRMCWYVDVNENLYGKVWKGSRSWKPGPQQRCAPYDPNVQTDTVKACSHMPNEHKPYAGEACVTATDSWERKRVWNEAIFPPTCSVAPIMRWAFFCSKLDQTSYGDYDHGGYHTDYAHVEISAGVSPSDLAKKWIIEKFGGLLDPNYCLIVNINRFTWRDFRGRWQEHMRITHSTEPIFPSDVSKSC
jgi:probable HAF family extracellular repeat protein